MYYKKGNVLRKMNIQRIENSKECCQYIADNPLCIGAVADKIHKGRLMKCGEDKYFFRIDTQKDIEYNFSITFGEGVRIDITTVTVVMKGIMCDTEVDGIWIGDWYHITTKLVFPFNRMRWDMANIWIETKSKFDMLLFKYRTSVVYLNVLQRRFFDVAQTLSINSTYILNYIGGLYLESKESTVNILTGSILDRIGVLQLYLPSKTHITTLIKRDGDNAVMYRVCQFLFIDIIIDINRHQFVETLENHYRLFYANIDPDIGTRIQEYKKRYEIISNVDV